MSLDATAEKAKAENSAPRSATSKRLFEVKIEEGDQCHWHHLGQNNLEDGKTKGG